MAMGATVSRIRIELIFRRCWNLITPCGSTAPQEARAPIDWPQGSEKPGAEIEAVRQHKQQYKQTGAAKERELF